MLFRSDGPDWGDLKHHDKPEEPVLNEVKKVPDEWVVPLKDKTIKELEDKTVVFQCSFSRVMREDERVKWCFKGEAIKQTKRYRVEILEDEATEELTVHQLTVMKPMHKDMGKYTCTAGKDPEIQTGSYLDVEDTPCYFTRQLKSFREIEHRVCTINCQVDNEDCDVTWFYNEIEIIKGYPDWQDKIKEVCDGRERSLVISDVPREAAGLFECKTNSDETKMTLRVTPINEFLKPLEDKTCTQKEEVTMECQMSDVDPDSRAEWLINGELVVEDDRIQIKALEKGIHRLVILHARLTDTGTVTCKCVGQNETEAQLMVNKIVVEAGAEPVQETVEKVKTKAAVKPRLVRDNIKDGLKIVTIKVGKSMSWSVDVIGEPITDKTWTKDDCYITKEKAMLVTEAHERIKVTNTDYNTLFECTNALRRDTCKYKVRAENCNGFDEEWVELCVLGAPARPEGPLEVSNISANGCKLRWKAPLDDGGCPIREYEIEMLCPRTKKWIRKGKCAGDKFPLFFDVDGLEEGQEYLFRVKAINDEGESEPLEGDKPIKAKNAFGKPKIDRKNLTTKTSKVGQNLLIDVDVLEGEPQPETMWTLLNQEIKTGDNIKIEHSAFNTKFTIEKGQRKNSKQYKVTATNEHGEDAEFVEVVFLGRPGMPLGPLEVYGATQDSCKLNWRAPEDDGGVPIRKYIVEKMDMATKKWLPVCETPGDVTDRKSVV